MVEIKKNTFLDVCFHMVVYIISSTNRLQQTVTVVYKMINFGYVCMYVAEGIVDFSKCRFV
jgi:hypothetical protein